jgi:hypothetical protein
LGFSKIRRKESLKYFCARLFQNLALIIEGRGLAATKAKSEESDVVNES